MNQLNGHVAFITGAARGQGRAHGLTLAKAGADIIAVDICRQAETVPYPMASTEDLRQTVEAVRALGRRAVCAEVDVRDLDGLRRVVNAGVAELGRLDIVVANAGISAPAPTLEMGEKAWDEMIEINLTGVWKTIVASVPHVRAGGRGGSVVITSSLAAMKANGNIAHYASAKAGLIGLMRVLAVELAPEQIRVNTLHPSTVATDMILNDATYRLFRPDLEAPTRADFEEAARTLNRLPIAALDSSDIAAAVLHLVGDTGRYITGTTVMLDAGGSL